MHIILTVSRPVVVRWGGEECDEDGEDGGGQAEVEGVAAGLSPAAAALPRLHHHTVAVLQPETEILRIILERLVRVVAGDEVEILVCLVPGEGDGGLVASLLPRPARPTRRPGEGAPLPEKQTR